MQFLDFPVEAHGEDEEDPVLTSELELKFVVEPGHALPDLGDVAHLGPTLEFGLDALYFDTPSCAITVSGGSLRRRSGGSDAGWHLKMKTESDHRRIEFQAPITGARPPGMLRAVLEDPLHRAPLLPIARLRTVRRETPLLDSAGRTLAVICRDLVWSQVPASTHLESDFEGEATWGEIEIELVEGDEHFLTRVSHRLISEGFQPADYGSKIERALELAGLWPPQNRLSEGGVCAQDAVMDYAATQVGIIQTLEDGIRSRAPEAVHKSRVAARRLRSTLRTFPRCFSADLASALVEELRWYGMELGAARDAEVLAERLEHTMQEAGVAHDPEVPTLRAWLQDRQDSAYGVAAETLATPRFEVFHDLLLALMEEIIVPPSSIRDEEGEAMIAIMVAKGARRYLKVLDQPSLPGWHDVRKTAKAIRYGYEALISYGKKGARERAESWEEVTGALGLLQDSAVAVEALRDFAQTPSKDQGRRDAFVTRLIDRETECEDQAVNQGQGALGAALKVTMLG